MTTTSHLIHTSNSKTPSDTPTNDLIPTTKVKSHSSETPIATTTAPALQSSVSKGPTKPPTSQDSSVSVLTPLIILTLLLVVSVSVFAHFKRRQWKRDRGNLLRDSLRRSVVSLSISSTQYARSLLEIEVMTPTKMPEKGWVIDGIRVMSLGVPKSRRGSEATIVQKPSKAKLKSSRNDSIDDDFSGEFTLPPDAPPLPSSSHELRIIVHPSTIESESRCHDDIDS